MIPSVSMDVSEGNLQSSINSPDVVGNHAKKTKNLIHHRSPSKPREKLTGNALILTPNRSNSLKRKPIPLRLEESQEFAITNRSRDIIHFSNYRSAYLTARLKPIDEIDRNRFCMKQMPQEILVHIFSFLPEISLCYLARVCKDFHTITNDDSLWRGLSMRRWNTCDVIVYNSWKQLFQDGNSKTQRGCFRLEITELGTRTDELFYSNKFKIGSYEWTLLIFPQGNKCPFLSVYLSVRGTLPTGPREASFSCTLINQKDPSKSVQRSSVYGSFIADSNSVENEDWGFTKFIELDRLMDPDEGYRVHDTAILDVYVANLSEFDYWVKLINSDQEKLQVEGTHSLFQTSFVEENKLKIQENGGLMPLIRLLRSQNMEIQKNASDTLWNLSTNDDNKIKIAELGGLESLVDLLSCGNQDIQRNVVNVLWNLSTIEENKTKIEKVGALKPLIDLLGSQLVEIRLNAVYVLWNLSTNDERKIRIVEQGALVPLVNLLLDNDTEVCCKASGVLYNLAINDVNKVKIVEAGGLKPLLLLLSRGNAEGQKIVSDLLWNLSWNDENKIKIVEENGLPILVSMLRSTDPEIQRNVAGALCNLAINDENKTKITQYDGLGPLVELLDSPNEDVQKNVVYILRNLSINDENEIKIVEQGALRPLIRLLESPNEEIRCKACGVIYNLAINDENKVKIAKEGALKPLIKLLNCRNEVEEILYKVAGILWNLSWNDSNEIEIVKENGLKPLIRLLSSRNVKVHLNAAGALCNLSTCDENKLKIVKLGGLDPLAKLLESPESPEDVTRNVTNVLWNLSTRAENSSKMMKALNLNAMNNLIRLNHPEIQRNCLYIIMNLAVINDVNRATIEKSDILPSLAELLYSENEDVQSDAASVLSKLLTSNKVKAVCGGIIERLLHMIKSNRRTVVSNAIMALLKLALNDENKTIITQLGGVEDLLSLLHPNRNVTEISPDAAACVVMNLATNENNRRKIIEKGGLELLLPLLGNHHPSTKNFSACAVGILSQDERAQAVLAENPNILMYLMEFLLISDNLEAQSHLAHALVQMHKYQKLISEIIFEKKFIPRILNVLGNCIGGSEKSKNRRLSVCNLVSYIAIIDDVAMAFKEADGEEFLKELMQNFPDSETQFCANHALEKLSAQKHPQLKKLRSFVDENKMYNKTHYIKVSPNTLQVRNDSSFLESVSLRRWVSTRGKWYYEVQVETLGSLMIGWVSQSHQFRPEQRTGVGDDQESWAYECHSNLKWHNNLPEPFETKRTKTRNPGDVIGCGIDLDSGKIIFFLNGKSLGTAFSGIPKNLRFSPAVSLTSEQQCQFNFGALPFKYALPNGFKSFDSCPSESRRNSDKANVKVGTKRAQLNVDRDRTPKKHKIISPANKSN
eukprot:TRINITY_DN6389_c0_g1_i1.p1 TRINITY_DN6389_c0_g1~~TRINITY_DN6389_c0_g1_i1.p1  ORF type:complete len:1380 (+),score=397.75 TRINITY_DN6389_c0_g1_i1:150-4289(+)